MGNIFQTAACPRVSQFRRVLHYRTSWCLAGAYAGGLTGRTNSRTGPICAALNDRCVTGDAGGLMGSIMFALTSEAPTNSRLQPNVSRAE